MLVLVLVGTRAAQTTLLLLPPPRLGLDGFVCLGGLGCDGNGGGGGSASSREGRGSALLTCV